MKQGRVFKWGGVVSGGVLIAFGIAVIVLALLGRNTLNNELEQQRIIGTPDMSPSGITAGIEAAGLEDVNIPDCDVAGKPIDSGPRARCFAQYAATCTRRWVSTGQAGGAGGSARGGHRRPMCRP